MSWGHVNAVLSELTGKALHRGCMVVQCACLLPGMEASDLHCDSLSRSLLESTPSPVVFCHNDCQEGKNCCLLGEAGFVCLLQR